MPIVDRQRVVWRGLALFALLASPSFARGQPAETALNRAFDQGVVDVVLRADHELPLDARWQGTLSDFDATAERISKQGDEEVWRLQVHEGMGQREQFLQWYLGSRAQLLAEQARPAVFVSGDDTGAALPQRLQALEEGIPTAMRTARRGRLDVAALTLLAAEADLRRHAPEGLEIRTASIELGTAYPLPQVLRPAPSSFVIDLDGEDALAVIASAERTDRGWTLQADLSADEQMGALRLEVGPEGVTGFGRTASRTYLMSAASSGESVSLSFDSNVPDHPSADATGPANAPTAAATNRCRKPFTNQVDLTLKPPAGGTATVKVLFVAEANASSMLIFTQSLIDQLNESVTYSGVPVKFEQVWKYTSAYTKPCGSTTDCWYRMCDELVAGTGELKRVHEARDTYGADVVVMLVSDVNFRGLASDIGASAPRAFVILGPNGIAQHTLGHEITHLAGGLHNQECELDIFPPRHGFISTNGLASTVMGTTCSAHAFSGLRMPYWSAADRVFPDGSPMTKEGCCDEALVLTSGAVRLSQFR